MSSICLHRKPRQSNMRRTQSALCQCCRSQQRIAGSCPSHSHTDIPSCTTGTRQLSCHTLRSGLSRPWCHLNMTSHQADSTHVRQTYTARTNATLQNSIPHCSQMLSSQYRQRSQWPALKTRLLTANERNANSDGTQQYKHEKQGCVPLE